ncbi:MAG TPA: RDD family protein [Steroidobacteraceae bacterium]|jgi:uncharacterized RDD family membrane protein YckC|nr:RDD family protein [Steroidobacteraceae bacterium]
MWPIYSGFWSRFAAFVIDTLLITIGGFFFSGLVLTIVTRLLHKATTESGENALIFLTIPVAAWLYFAAMESSPGQSTVGKLAMKIKVTDLSGEKIGFGCATGRFFAKFLSALSLGVGYVMAVFTSRRQSLHDKVAGTLVVQRSLLPPEIAKAEPAPPISTAARTLIVIAGLLFNPTTIGLVAAIAIGFHRH